MFRKNYAAKSGSAANGGVRALCEITYWAMQAHGFVLGGVSNSVIRDNHVTIKNTDERNSAGIHMVGSGSLLNGQIQTLEGNLVADNTFINLSRTGDIRPAYLHYTTRPTILPVHLRPAASDCPFDIEVNNDGELVNREPTATYVFNNLFIGFSQQPIAQQAYWPQAVFDCNLNTQLPQ